MVCMRCVQGQVWQKCICTRRESRPEQVIFSQHLQGRNAPDGADLAAVLPAGTGGGTCETAAGGLPGICLCRIPGGTGKIYRSLVCPKKQNKSEKSNMGLCRQK